MCVYVEYLTELNKAAIMINIYTRRLLSLKYLQVIDPIRARELTNRERVNHVVRCLFIGMILQEKQTIYGGFCGSTEKKTSNGNGFAASGHN